MANFVKKLNARCRGEPVEEDESMPITIDAINDGKNLVDDLSPEKKQSTSIVKKTSSLLSRIQEDEQSDATPDTDTVSTLSNSRSIASLCSQKAHHTFCLRSTKMTNDLARSILGLLLLLSFCVSSLSF